MGFFREVADIMGDMDLVFGGDWKRLGQDEQNRRRQQGGLPPSAYEWDPETAMPIGLDEAPPEGTALAFQWRAKQMTRRRNIDVVKKARDDAMGYLDQGARASESYRPGGHASFGFYGARAQVALSAGMAQQIEEPDLLMKWRDAKAERSEAYAHLAERQAQRGQLLQLAGTVIGAIYGGGAGAAAGGALGGSLGGAGDAANRAKQQAAQSGQNVTYYD